MTAANLTEISPKQTSEPPKVQLYDIGKQFARQYYTFFSREPNKLHCFYSENASLTMGEEQDAEVKPVIGVKEISKKLAEQKFGDCKVCINSLDVQKANGGDILVVVIGDLVHNSGSVKKFAQTFLMHQQDGAYFVSNSVCRYLSNIDLAEEEVVVVEKIVSAAPLEVKLEPVQPEEKEQQQIPGPAEPALAKPHPKPTEKESKKEESPQPIAEEPTGPQSWAKLAATQREKWGSTASAKPNVATIKEEPKHEKREKKEKISADKPAADSKGAKNVNVPASVFVRNLPENATVPEVKQALGKIGTVKYVDFNNTKQSAVVEFATVEFAKLAVGAEVSIRSTLLTIEERRPKPTQSPVSQPRRVSSGKNGDRENKKKPDAKPKNTQQKTN